EALEGCDLILLIVDVTKRLGAEDEFALKMAQQTGTPVFLLLNKVDLLRDKKALLPIIEDYRKRHDFKEVIPLSALKKEGLDLLRSRRTEGHPSGKRRADAKKNRHCGPT